MVKKMILYRGLFFLFWLAFTALHVTAQQKEIKIACIGNSITFGMTHKNPQLSSYLAVLQKMLGGKYKVGNFGHSGATLLRKGHNPYYKTDAFKAALDFTPDIAIIHLGLNDTDPRNWPNYRDEFVPDYAWLIDTIRQVNPLVKIYISRLSPISHGHARFRSGTRDWYDQIQELIPQIAKVNNTGLIDFYTPLYARPELLPDNIHPNEKGAALLAKQVYQKISGDFGGLQLSPVFASHMVLQRGRPIPFYGTANAGEKISVSFNGKQQSITAGDDGKWKVVFPTMKAGGPYTASFASAAGQIMLEDILLGDVWLCSGQSNMAFQLRAAVNDKMEMAAAQKSNNIRLLNRKVIAETDNKAWDSLTLDKINDLDYFTGTWQRCDSTTAKSFSAVAYYFGKKLEQQLNVPIGLIQVAVGGSTTESWIDRYTMEHHPVLVNELYNWRKSDFFQPWARERADTNLKNSTDLKQRHPYEPCYNYEAGIQPLTGFPIQGVIWYQGESNAHNIELHETVFPEMVKSWRKQWGYDFPFYYVQLSSLNRPSWPSFRNSQRLLLKEIPNAGMAVSSDAGHPTDVHPRNKKPVGERLARLALHFNYQQKNIVPYGPLPVSAVKQNNQVVISFQYAHMLKTNDGKSLRGFKVVNEKGQHQEANAFIQNDKVILPVGKEQKPVAVVYGWEPFTNANLVNGDDLPASTFKIDVK